MNSPSMEKKKTTFMTDTGMIKQKSEIKKESSLEKTIKPAYEDEEEEDVKDNHNDVNGAKFETLYDKILFKPPYSGYYQKFPITPGTNFIKKMFSHDRAEKLIKTLKINMPETYWNDSEMFYIYNDPKQLNQLTMIKNKRDFDMYTTLKNLEQKYYKRTFEGEASVDPFVITRLKDSDFENSVKVERFEKAKDVFAKEVGDGILQRYIRSKGRNRELDKEDHSLSKIDQTTTTTRNHAKKSSLIFGNQLKSSVDSSKDLREVSPEKNDLYVFSSPNKEHTKGNFDKSDSQKNMPVVSFYNKYISAESKANFIKVFSDEKKKVFTKPSIIRLVYKTRYNNSKQPNIAYCLNNKEYIEPIIRTKKNINEKYSSYCTLQTLNRNSFNIYIMAGESVKPYEYYANEIVVFVQKLYKIVLKTIVIDFIKDERGLIYFLGVKFFSPVKEPEDIGPDMNIRDYLKDENNIKKIYKTWTCKLCQVAYPKAKVTKVVTLKLLIQLKENLEKRGKGIFQHINKTNFNESQSCRVCDLCYKVLLTEQELMEIQKTIAIINNIPVQSEDDLLKKKKIPENVPKNPIKLNTANQWRVMFYFVRFYMIELDKLAFEDRFNYKLYIKLFDQKFGIPIFTDIEKFKAQDEIEINLSKIFYFFTLDNSTLKQILKNEEVDFRIVINDDWANPLAQCVTTCLSFYENESATKTARVKNTLNFFSNELKYFKCQVYVGLNNDGEIQSKEMPFYPHKTFNSILLTDQDYFSYHPLPDDWYELFVQPDTRMDEFYDFNLDQAIDKIIYDLEYRKVTRKEKEIIKKNEEKIYDPYETLVKIQEKRNLISKIKSIPVIQDKKYIDSRKQSAKTRPQTTMLMSKFKFMPIINENKNEAISTHYNENLQPGMNSRINSGVSSTSSVYAAKYTFPNVRTPKDLSYRNVVTENK